MPDRGFCRVVCRACLERAIALEELGRIGRVGRMVASVGPLSAHQANEPYRDRICTPSRSLEPI